MFQRPLCACVLNRVSNIELLYLWFWRSTCLKSFEIKLLQNLIGTRSVCKTFYSEQLNTLGLLSNTRGCRRFWWLTDWHHDDEKQPLIWSNNWGTLDLKKIYNLLCDSHGKCDGELEWKVHSDTSGMFGNFNMGGFSVVFPTWGSRIAQQPSCMGRTVSCIIVSTSNIFLF